MRLDWRRVLGFVALASAVGEVVSAFWIEVPPAALVFATLFLAGWLWLRRGGVAPVLLLAVLLVIELAALPTYERERAVDWILQAVFAVLGVVGLVASPTPSRRAGASSAPAACT